MTLNFSKKDMIPYVAFLCYKFVKLFLCSLKDIFFNEFSTCSICFLRNWTTGQQLQTHSKELSQIVLIIINSNCITKLQMQNRSVVLQACQIRNNTCPLNKQTKLTTNILIQMSYFCHEIPCCFASSIIIKLILFTAYFVSPYSNFLKYLGAFSFLV